MASRRTLRARQRVPGRPQNLSMCQVVSRYASSNHLATSTHRFFQRLQSASVARHHHTGNTKNQQDHTDCNEHNGACWIIAKNLHLEQHAYDKCDNTDHNNGNVSRGISHSIEPFLSSVLLIFYWADGGGVHTVPATGVEGTGGAWRRPTRPPRAPMPAPRPSSKATVTIRPRTMPTTATVCNALDERLLPWCCALCATSLSASRICC